MISYEVYKIVHITAIFFFLSTAGAQLLGDTNSKLAKILNGVATLFILVGGMGLLARIGVSHGEGWPAWVIGKLIVWLLVAILVPVVGKRFSSKGKIAYWAVMGLAFVATYLAVTHT